MSRPPLDGERPGLPPGTRVAALARAEFDPLIDAAADVYGAAMRRSPATIASRRDLMRAHLNRDGFVAVAATAGDTLLGFGYGYLGSPGQWWYDVVAAALDRPARASWLADSFELAELHVAPPYQGNGLGRRLIDLLLELSGGTAVVLSTPDSETPARALYRSLGFVDLLTDFRFPGSADPYAVMGWHR